jgi:hypothetical protein
MANVDRPSGLTWCGGDPGFVAPCYIADTYETALFIGDPVVVVAAGSNAAREAGTVIGDYDIGTLKAIERSSVADNGVIDGVIEGFAPATQDSLTYREADTERIALVRFAPLGLWEAQAPAAVPATSVGLNAIGANTHAGSTVTGRSGMEISTIAADASNPFAVERIVPAPDNEPNAAFNKVIVRINTTNRLTIEKIGI